MNKDMKVFAQWQDKFPTHNVELLARIDNLTKKNVEIIDCIFYNMDGSKTINTLINDFSEIRKIG